MKKIIIGYIVFFIFLPAVYAETCYLLKSGENIQIHNGPALLDIQTNDMSWSYNTSDQIVATGKITVWVEDKPQSRGHNCSVQAQLLLMRDNEILACYTAPEVEGVTGAYLYFEHTFIVGSNYGPLNSLCIKSRASAFACFSNWTYGDSEIYYIQENTCDYNPPPQPLVLPPSNPTDLTLTNSNFFVLLNWSGGEGADSFKIYRKTGYYGNWEEIGTTTSKTYLDEWVFIEPNPMHGVETFYYRVRALNFAGFSPGYSNIVSVVGTLIE